jgi:hypothetical protein
MPMYDHITPEQADLIENSHVFFVASVHPDLTKGPAEEGPVNLSPKGGVILHIIDEHRVAYLDYPGSGNETARHAEAGGPVTVMVMSMEAENAAIVRLYGYATTSPVDESPLSERILSQPAEHLNRPRQIIDVRVESTQTSCGYGVPVYDYVGERAKDGRGRRYKQPTRS